MHSYIRIIENPETLSDTEQTLAGLPSTLELLPRKEVAMTHTVSAAYAHRQNRDGSIDSICKTCFATIAQAKNELALTQHEWAHSCPEWIRSRVNLYLVPRYELKA